MNRSAPGRRQGGAVLIVTLMFLVILTLLGVTAMTSTTMEERMAGNTRDSAIALQAAESALRDARRDISNLPVSGVGRGMSFTVGDFGNALAEPGTCNSSTDPDLRGLCLPALDPSGDTHGKKLGAIVPSFPQHSLSGPPSLAYGEITGANDLGGEGKPVPATVPRYIIEGYCMRASGESLQPFCNFYRITARGYGRNPNTQITLQETFVSL